MQVNIKASKVEKWRESNSWEQMFWQIAILFVLVRIISEAHFIAICISTKRNKA
jgi:hypothetical protein